MIRTRQISCPACSSRQTRARFMAQDRLHGVEGLFSYVKCRICGLTFMNPQVVPEDIGALYPADYAPHATNAPLDRASETGHIPAASKPMHKRPSGLARAFHDFFTFDKTPWGLLGSLAYACGGDGTAPARWRRKMWLRRGLLPFTALLGLSGYGDTLVVTARKPS